MQVDNTGIPVLVALRGIPRVIVYACCAAAVALLGAPEAPTPGSVASVNPATSLNPVAAFTIAAAQYPDVAAEPVGFGDAGSFGWPGGSLNAPVVGMAATADGNGYWLVASDGGVFSYGDAGFHGSEGGAPLNAPVVGIASDPVSGGYWLVASDGGVFSFGGARFFGSMGGSPLNAPVVGMAATADGNGYRLVAADGGVFSFGDAGFDGSEGGAPLNAPVVGMASDPVSGGYWLVASDGGVFSFGGARFLGSMGGTHLNAPVTGMVARSDGGGYWLGAYDGGVFTFGDAGFFGSMGSEPLPNPVTAIAATADGGGYWLLPTKPRPVIQAAAAADAGSQIAATAVRVALAQVGKPYVTGGSGPGGFDCSGLTQYAYAAAGVYLPRTALEQFDAVRHVSLADAQPGDLLFFYSGITHVGINLGNGRMVDAAHPGTYVRVESYLAGWGPVMGVGRPW